MQFARHMVGQPDDPIQPFQVFLNTLSRATNESQRREAFVILAATGFNDSALATDLALSSEYQVRFKSSGLIRRGAIDSFFGNIIIEFENDLERSRQHALDQLRGYVAGAWAEDNNTTRPYLAVATDGKRWELYTPRIAQPGASLDARHVELDKAEEWLATGHDDASTLRDFLNRLLFRKRLIQPTAINFARDFGLTSPAYLVAVDRLRQKYAELCGRFPGEEDPQLAVLQDAWLESLRTAYGSLDPDIDLFIRHTYLATLARLLVWASIERRAMRPEELESVLGGLYFQSRRVANLVEDDFFQWTRIPSRTSANPIWLALTEHLSGYDLRSVPEDILKPLYEQLVDPDTRHDLGEFYTPDWLATAVVNKLLRTWHWESVPSVLDPTCGSGTFLRATIDLVRSKMEQSRQSPALLQQILSGVVGIDVHPLAVVTAKATYLLAIGDLLHAADRPISIPVYLANSLEVNMDAVQLSLTDESSGRLRIANNVYPVPGEFMRSGADFDRGIEEVVTVARSFGRSSGPLEDADVSLHSRLADEFRNYSNRDQLVETLGRMARDLASLVRERRDTIYGFLLKNVYRPTMLVGLFDYVVGNPPWLTVSDIASPSYKNLIIELAVGLGIAPRGSGDQSHTELATLFLASAPGRFLKSWDGDQESRIAFVVPRSVFSASQHRLLREGRYRARLDVTEIWDLNDVSPLFNVPACVLFASTMIARPNVRKSGIVWRGVLPEKDLSWDNSEAYLVRDIADFELAYLGRRSTWRHVTPDDGMRPAAGSSAVGSSHYRELFRQGAVLYPQVLFVVETSARISRRSGEVHVRTDPFAAKSARKLREASVDCIVDTRNLYVTAAAGHVLPYAISPHLWKAVLPTVVDPGDPDFSPVDSDVLRKAGRVRTADWLDWAEERWREVRKAGESVSLVQRLNYMQQFSAQSAMPRYIVLFTGHGSRPVACVVDRLEHVLPFVVRDRTYWAPVGSFAEGMYLCSFLNSDYAASSIVDWMTRGLYGPRDMHKRVVDVGWPAFDGNDGTHQELALLGSEAFARAREVAAEAMSAGVGRSRSVVRVAIGEALWSDIESRVLAVAAEFR